MGSLRLNAIAVLTGLIFFVGAIDEAVPQSCTTLQTDNNKQLPIQAGGNSNLNWVWTTTGEFILNQNSNGFITGSLMEPACNTSDYYTTQGTINAYGGFSLTSTYQGNNSGCASTLTMTGTVTGPGCATASGNFSNSSNVSGSFTMAHACFVPTGEANQVFQNWTQLTKLVNGQNEVFAVAVFNVQAAPVPPTFSWGGRTVSETFPQPADDGCWFPGSTIPQIVSLPTISVTLGASGTYQDSIGPWTKAVTYYRQKGRTPCSITTQQVMIIDCPTPPADPTYATITQVDTISPLALIVTRGNNPPVSEIFGPPAPALTLPAILFNLLFPSH